MTKRTRRTHRPGFMATVGPAGLKGEKALAELAKLFDVRPYAAGGGCDDRACRRGDADAADSRRCIAGRTRPKRHQGSQFTGAAFTGMRQDNAIATDGHCAWRYTVFVGRLWRSRAYDSLAEACVSRGRYLEFYNHRPSHSGLGARTPEQAYLDHMRQRMAA